MEDPTGDTGIPHWDTGVSQPHPPCPPDYELLSELSPADVTLRDGFWGHDSLAMSQDPEHFQERHLKYISLLGKVGDTGKTPPNPKTQLSSSPLPNLGCGTS